jgi:hypothetical protein
LAILTYTTIFCYTQLFEEYLVVKLSGVTVAYGDRFILKDADFLIKKNPYLHTGARNLLNSLSF